MKQIEKLYLEYSRDIYKYLLSITYDPTLSEDIVSETFLKAILSIGNFRGDSTIKTWLFGIARNLWLQSLRNDKYTVEYNDLLDVYGVGSISDSIVSKQIGDRIYELLTTKDEQTQKIIMMRLNRISYYEISEKLGISENSARVSDFRTKKWIKSILKKEELI